MVGVRSRMFYRRCQRGAGWGWLTRFASRALPYLTRGARSLGDQMVTTLADRGVETSMRFLDDVLDGENVLESAKHRLKEGRRELKDEVKNKAREQGLKLASRARSKLAEKARSLKEQQQQQQAQEGGGLIRMKRGAVVRMGPGSVGFGGASSGRGNKRKGKRRGKVSRARGGGARGRAKKKTTTAKRTRKNRKRKAKKRKTKTLTAKLGYQTIFD
jgi:hypothetical protein